MTVKIKVDKVVFDFCDIKFTDFMNFYISIRKDPSFQEVRSKGYNFGFSVNHGENCMFFSYENYQERTAEVPHKPLYTLRLETAPINFKKYRNIIDQINRISGAVNFVSADVAYDLPVPLMRVFVMCNDDRRKINLCGTTRYFGWGDQRKQNGYCRVYDKAEQLRVERQIFLRGDLSRIEIVYKPDRPVPFKEIMNKPPQQGIDYFGVIIDDLSWCRAKRRMQILNKQIGIGEETQYIRREIKKTLANQVEINFNQLASEDWANIISVPVKALLNGQPA